MLAEQKKILIVEDDRAIRETLADLLRMEGYTVDTAANGQLGIEKLRSEYRPDLVLLDLMMPIKDGFQFRAEQIEDPQLATIPVIVMTAYARTETERLSISPRNYLKKPLSLDTLLNTIKRNTVLT